MAKFLNLSHIKQLLISLKANFTPVVLFSQPMSAWRNGQGGDTNYSQGTITLNDDCTNYARLVIQAISDDNIHTTINVVNPQVGKCFSIWDWVFAGNTNSTSWLYLEMISYRITSATTIEKHWQAGQKKIGNNTSVLDTSAIYFTITKIIGYKH